MILEERGYSIHLAPKSDLKRQSSGKRFRLSILSMADKCGRVGYD